jgi:hypothetical protein
VTDTPRSAEFFVQVDPDCQSAISAAEPVRFGSVEAMLRFWFVRHLGRVQSRRVETQASVTKFVKDTANSGTGRR